MREYLSLGTSIGKIAMNMAQELSNNVDLNSVILAANGPDLAAKEIAEQAKAMGIEPSNVYCNEIYFSDGSRIVVNDSIACPRNRLFRVMEFKHLNL